MQVQEESEATDLPKMKALSIGDKSGAGPSSDKGKITPDCKKEGDTSSSNPVTPITTQVGVKTEKEEEGEQDSEQDDPTGMCPEILKHISVSIRTN